MKAKDFSLKSNQRTLILAVTALALGLFLQLTWELYEKDQKLYIIDQFILSLFLDLRMDMLNGPAVDLTALGSPVLISIIAGIASIVLVFVGNRKGMVHLLLATAGAGGWTWLLKHLISRERPLEVPKLVEVVGFSYPSGHSLSATTLFLTLAIIGGSYLQKISHRVVLLLLAILMSGLVGLSRIYLGVHYPSDALSGFFFGCAWALGISWLLGYRQVKKNQN